jgi:adenine phosphoribosyltransferase
MNNKEYENLITKVPDFPKPGVIFKDFSPLLKHKLPEIIDDMGKNINWDEVDVVLGIESRGFILGAALALKFNKGFLPVRKKGKLPPPVIGVDYELEYGSDTLEMTVNDEKLNVIIVDDVIATGGTLKAAFKLCEQNNFTVKGVSALIDLKFLNKLSRGEYHIHSVLNYD